MGQQEPRNELERQSVDTDNRSGFLSAGDLDIFDAKKLRDSLQKSGWGAIVVLDRVES